MKKTIIIFLTFILTISFAFASETPEVIKQKAAVFPLNDYSEYKGMDKAGKEIKKIIEQNLLLLGKYNVIKENNSIDKNNLLEYCMENNIDFIIHGDIFKKDRGGLINLYVYSRKEQTDTILTSETADSPLNLRYAVKAAVSDLLEQFSGQQIDFTSLIFTNMSNEKGEYNIYIDDILFGRNTDYIETVLSGKRNIKIVQDRIYGKYILGEINASLMPEDRVSMEFKIPPLLKKEEKYIKRYSKTIDAHLNDKYYSKKTASSFNNLFSLLENPEFSNTAVSLKKEYTEKYETWLKNMDSWEGNTGFTTSDKPLSLGFKTMAMVSSFDITDWDMGGSKPDNTTKPGFGLGVTASADIFSFLGLQAEALVCNQRTETLYPTAHPVLNLSEIKTSTWFFEAPAIIYFKVPEKLFKLYAGLSYKYRISPIKIRGKDAVTGENKNKKYSDSDLNMYHPSWLAGFALEFPFKNNVFSLDFRFNRDFDSWFDPGTPEEDYIAQYLAYSIGYSGKF